MKNSGTVVKIKNNLVWISTIQSGICCGGSGKCSGPQTKEVQFKALKDKNTAINIGDKVIVESSNVLIGIFFSLLFIGIPAILIIANLYFNQMYNDVKSASLAFGVLGIFLSILFCISQIFKKEFFPYITEVSQEFFTPFK